MYVWLCQQCGRTAERCTCSLSQNQPRCFNFSLTFPEILNLNSFVNDDASAPPAEGTSVDGPAGDACDGAGAGAAATGPEAANGDEGTTTIRADYYTVLHVGTVKTRFTTTSLQRPTPHYDRFF